MIIKKFLDIQHNQLSSRVERGEHEGSGWTIHSSLQHLIAISEIASCKGSSYFLLPQELRNPMKILINIQNEDNECFR